jgi:hypothetical protein
MSEKPIPSSQRLSFKAAAVREHYEGDDSPVALAIEQADDAIVTKIGEYALEDDRIYRAFHEALEDAANHVFDEEAGGFIATPSQRTISAPRHPATMTARSFTRT